MASVMRPFLQKRTVEEVRCASGCLKLLCEGQTSAPHGESKRLVCVGSKFTIATIDELPQSALDFPPTRGSDEGPGMWVVTDMTTRDPMRAYFGLAPADLAIFWVRLSGDAERH